MPRSPRYCPGGHPVHVIQRGNDRRIIFTSEADKAAYANWLADGAQRFGVAVHGWVFMSNHVHLLVTPGDAIGVSRMMQFLGRLYVRYFNHAYDRTGTLFEGRFRSCLVQEEQYFLACLRYIELNPVRAGMVGDPGAYHWSSYQAHGLGVRPRLWSPHRLYLGLGSGHVWRQRRWRELVGEALHGDLLAKIRHCANRGLALGTEAYRKEMAAPGG